MLLLPKRATCDMHIDYTSRKVCLILKSYKSCGEADTLNVFFHHMAMRCLCGFELCLCEESLWIHRSLCMSESRRVLDELPDVMAGGKQHTSHSTVEKNRRDRINSLIDEVPFLHHQFQTCASFACQHSPACMCVKYTSIQASCQVQRTTISSFDSLYGCHSCEIWCHHSKKTVRTRPKIIWTPQNGPSMLYCQTLSSSSSL